MSKKTSVGVALTPDILAFYEEKAKSKDISLNKILIQAITEVVFDNKSRLNQLLLVEQQDPFVDLSTSPKVKSLYLDDNLLYQVDTATMTLKRSEALRLILSYHIRRSKTQLRKSLINGGNLRTKVSKMQEFKDYKLKGTPEFLHETILIRKEHNTLSVTSMGGEFETPQTVCFDLDTLSYIPMSQHYKLEELTFKDVEKIAFLAFEYVLTGKRPDELKDKIFVKGQDNTNKN